MVPPGPQDIPEIARGLRNVLRGMKTGAWKQLTVKQAAVNLGITIEVICWFFVGECIGKGGVIGYAVGSGHH